MILADEIERLCSPAGLSDFGQGPALLHEVAWCERTPNQHGDSVVRGDFRHDPSLKQEFFELVRQQESMLST